MFMGYFYGEEICVQFLFLLSFRVVVVHTAEKYINTT